MIVLKKSGFTLIELLAIIVVLVIIVLIVITLITSVVKKARMNVTKLSGQTHKGIVYLDPTDLIHKCDINNSVSATGIRTDV